LLALTEIFDKEVRNEFFKHVETIKMKESKNIKIEGKDILNKLISLEEDEHY
jgi:hypothetical protein